MSDSIQFINEYLDSLFTYGPWVVYGVIFVACFIENLFPPFPGDSFIVGAGALVGLSRLQLIPAMITVITGGMLSVTILYVLGRKYGRGFFLKRNYKYFSAKDIETVEKQLGSHGGLILIASRFVVGFRSALAVGAGIGRYPMGRLVIYSTLSYILFSTLLIFLAMSLVENLDLIQRYFTVYNYVAWPVLIALVVLFMWRRRKNGHRDGMEVKP